MGKKSTFYPFNSLAWVLSKMLALPPTDIVPTLLDRLKRIAIGPYEKFARSIIKGRIHTTSRLVDNSKVSDHHAIIPTEQHVDLSSLNREEKNIYDLVVKRFLEVLSQPLNGKNNYNLLEKGKLIL